MVLRHLYILRGSWPRVLEMAYWPTLNMVVWGFTSRFFAHHSSLFVQAAGMLIGAVILWDVMFRGNLGVALSFLEEIWSRNLGHLAVSPLRPWEWVAAMVTMSLIRTLIGVIPAALLAIPFYHFSIFSLGPALFAFWINLLVTGWAIGLGVSALVLRFGLGAESLAWVVVFAIAPVAAVYYPVAVMPGWLQHVAWSLPPAYVFEGMRSLMFGHGLRLDLLAGAAGLNLVYLAATWALFLRTVHIARRRGLLLNVGE
jgi:ABC-2 type transport system permease protein